MGYFCTCPRIGGVKRCERRADGLCNKEYNRAYDALGEAYAGEREWGEDPNDTARRHDFQRRSRTGFSGQSRKK